MGQTERSRMIGKSMRVLLVEDEPAYADVLREQLTELGTQEVQVAHVTSLRAADRSLREESFDLGLLDLNLPDSEGLQTYSRFREAAPRLPVIVVTGLDDANLALTAMREGAQDYLVKGELGAKLLHRAIRYAIERKRAEEAVRQSEEFFRLIAENVTDLIAVIDQDGRRLYNSPSYEKLLGEPSALVGTNSFEEIHPADRDRIVEIFQNTLRTHVGTRTEYRMILKNGAVRFIESQGNVIHADGMDKVVVVSRDITERKASTELLREALSDLKKSHEALKTTQKQLVQAERLEAVSTFAGGVAHEVKNPLQTIILGVDYLANRIKGEDPTAKMVLTDMSNAVERADAIIRGLMDFSGHTKRQIRQENLTDILEHALAAIQPELTNYPVTLHKELAQELPLLELDHKTIKHVFINLLMQIVRTMPSEGGQLRLRTYSRELRETLVVNGKALRYFGVGDKVVCAQIEDRPHPSNGTTEFYQRPASENRSPSKDSAFGITILRRIVELYGAVIDVETSHDAGSVYRVFFKVPSSNPSTGESQHRRRL